MVLRTAGESGAGSLRDILAFRPGEDDGPAPLIAVDGRAEQGPALSPDGRWLAYSSDETVTHEVFVRSFPDVDNVKVQVSTRGGIRPMWSPTGDELFYVAGTASAAEMVAVRYRADDAFSVVQQHTLFSIPLSYIHNPNLDFYDVSPDGQRFLMGRQVIVERGSETRRPELILVQNWFEELERLLEN